MKKLKSKILFLIIIISLLIYYKDDYEYNSNYEILTDSDAFARYSNGLIYINNGNDNYLNIKSSDIIINDERNSCDPNIKIFSSHLINDKNIRNEILEVLCIYENMNPSEWNRTIESMRMEWFIHNLSYYLNLEKDRSKDVDLNNFDEEKYNNEIIRKILKL